MLDEEVSPRVVTITNSRVQPLAYSKPRFPSSSSFLCFFKVQNRKQKVVIGRIKWRPAAGWRTSSLWYQMLESREAASVEEGSHDVLLWRRTCVWKIESNTICTERERHTHTKSITLLSKVCATVTKWTTTFTKGYKVTLYSDSLRATALYPIYINDPNLGTQRGQCEYDHYTLVFDTTEINGLESSGTCRTLCSTRVEPPGRLSYTVPIPIIAQCCEFPTRTESECRSEYCRNWDRWGVTWYNAPESMSHVLNSLVVSTTSDSTVFSMDNMFGSVVRISDEELT